MSYEAAERTSARAAATPPSGDGPVITHYGQVAYDIISAAQAEHPKTAMPGQLIPARGDSPRLKIGYLSDPDSATTIILEDSRSSSVIRKTTITFRTAMLIELFSQVEPGKKAEAQGEGVFYTDSRWKQPGAADGRHTVASPDHQLTLEMELSQNPNKVTVSYSMNSAHGKIEFKPGRASR